MRTNNFNTILRISASKFDLIKKVVSKFNSNCLRIDHSILILRNSEDELAVVNLAEFLNKEIVSGISVQLPKDRQNVINLAKTNGNIEFLDIDEQRLAIRIGNYTTELIKLSQREVMQLSLRQIKALAVTQKLNLNLQRKLVTSLSKNRKTTISVHVKGNEIASLGTGCDAVNFSQHTDWEEKTDIVINVDLKIFLDCPEITAQMVKASGKHFLLIEYTMAENFVIRHFFKAN